MAAPPAWPALIGSPVDWGYSTVVQHGLLETELAYPRGKVLGGSSGINAMAHLRAHRASYDAWAAGGAHETPLVIGKPSRSARDRV
jgi:choline dehydrogenase